MDISTFVATTIIRLVSESYKKKPILTIVGILSFALAFTSLVITAFYLEKHYKAKVTINNDQLKERVEKIDQIQSSLKELDNFLEDQELSIRNQQIVLESLKEERNEIEPVVEANREVIDKVFTIQEKRNKWDLWIGIGIGFLVGIPASFLASIFHDYYKKQKVPKNDKISAKA